MNEGPRPTGGGSRGRRAVPAAVAAACVAVLAWWTRPFFPTPDRTMGHDWSYFLPAMLAGQYWLSENGLLVPPTFTPAFCGGVPLLANPQSVFYSLPQALFLWVGPLEGAHLLLVGSAVAGAAGTYALLRGPFGASREAATLAAVIFLFNGFLTFRLIIGQPHFHTFALIPWIARLALADPHPPGGRWQGAPRCLMASAGVGLAVAYFVYAGAPNLLVPAGGAVVMLWLLHALVRGPRPSFWVIGLGGSLLGAAIAAWNLAPTWAFMDAIPRDQGINMFDRPVDGLLWLIRGLFFAHTIQDGAWFGRAGVGFPRSEAEFGVTPVPLVLMALVLWSVLRSRRTGTAGAGVWSRRLLAFGTPLAVLAALPYLLSVHLGGWAWHDLLNQIPYLRDHAQLMRWWLVYIPLVVAGSALAFDRIFTGSGARLAGFTAGAVAVVLFTLSADLSHYEEEPYDPALVVEARDKVRAGVSPPPIREVGWPPEDGSRGERTFSLDLNDRMTEGVSPFPCYEPAFGYFLRFFPHRATLERAPPWRLTEDGRFNLRNPACYVYGEANRCEPGHHFTVGQASSVAALTHYRPFPYEKPLWQRAAAWSTVAGLLLALLALAAPPAGALLRRRR